MVTKTKAETLADAIVDNARYGHETQQQATLRRNNACKEAAAHLRAQVALIGELVEAAKNVLSNKRGEDDWLILAVHCRELEEALAKAEAAR